MTLTRRSLALAAGWLAAAAAAPALAQTPANSPADEKAVADAVERLRQAMIAADRARLEATAAEALTYGHSSGRVENKEQFVAAIVEGRSVFRSINLSEQAIQVSGDVATVRHLLTAETMDGGRPGNVRIGVLLVMQKQGGDWKLLARQAVPRPA
ncbi:nuclear transport factor 2 family protein [Roseomonas nepalensis]|uniref:Nuclear transport factor 2 family protein n=1 Tax=Muricoccus nepalensis TaxID=1854500 RepID=A0A502G4X2_9PROT|nr:nuclear transport factor 2 family protein [Roseomonas nepalensis]TPG56918.1 nuclear transport factor 2 family protein [Roseomonas nepalensis]